MGLRPVAGHRAGEVHGVERPRAQGREARSDLRPLSLNRSCEYLFSVESRARDAVAQGLCAHLARTARVVDARAPADRSAGARARGRAGERGAGARVEVARRLARDARPFAPAAVDTAGEIDQDWAVARATDPEGALAGIRSVVLSPTYVGMQVAQFMSDNGSEVVLVEPSGGSPLRRAAAWPAWSRGSKSVELGLDRDAAAAQAVGIASGADVVFEAFRPNVVERWGLGYEQLAATNPALVYASVTAFGRHGPLARLKGYEGVVMAKIGAYDQFTALVDRSGPAFASVPYCWFSAAQLAIQGILTALFERTRSGLGQRVDTTSGPGRRGPRRLRLDDPAHGPAVSRGVLGGAAGRPPDAGAQHLDGLRPHDRVERRWPMAPILPGDPEALSCLPPVHRARRARMGSSMGGRRPGPSERVSRPGPHRHQAAHRR